MNTLYPIFLKTTSLKILIVGGGNVGTEKVTFLLKNSPHALVSVLAKEISSEIQTLQKANIQIVLMEKEFEPKDLIGFQLCIAATANKELNAFIHQEAKKQKILINVADTPELCDFYLGSVISKGDLKIAISTNGQSPTLAKRLRQMFEEVIPDSIDEVLVNLNEIRNQLKGDFEHKVKEMEEITKIWFKSNNDNEK